MGLKDVPARQVQQMAIPAPNLQTRIALPVGSDTGTFFSPPLGALLQPRHVEPAIELKTNDSKD